MRWILIALVIAAAGLLAYIRLAPSDAARWHVDPGQAQDPGPRGALLSKAVSLAPAEALARLAEIALAEPRTVLLAGSPAEGRLTFVARSRVFGFPDYVTVSAAPNAQVDAQGQGDGEGAQLHILSRLRFGGSDLGVNAARAARWLAQL